MNLENLTTSEREVFNLISTEAIDIVKDNADGCEFVRINLYQDALSDLLEKNETSKEVIGAHFFTTFQSDDINKENQIEIGNFQQEELAEDWDQTITGENWLRKMEEELDEEIFNAIINQRISA